MAAFSHDVVSLLVFVKLIQTLDIRVVQLLEHIDLILAPLHLLCVHNVFIVDLDLPDQVCYFVLTLSRFTLLGLIQLLTNNVIVSKLFFQLF